VRHYPEIVFIPKQVEGIRAEGGCFYGRIRGLVQLHGTVHEVATEFHGDLAGDQLSAECEFLLPYLGWGVESPNVLAPGQIVSSVRGDNTPSTRMFAAFSYLLPLLRKIPPNIFEVSDFAEVEVKTSGRVIWAPQPQARQVLLISPPADVH
jgi:hypothetical protein